MSTNIPDVKTDYAPPASDDEVLAWLHVQASEDRPFLLVYADDGVVWGKWMNGQLAVAPEKFHGVAVELRGETLQQAHIFGNKEEIRLFRGMSGQWSASKITDHPQQDAFDEIHILWGNQVVGDPVAGFSHTRDRVQQGMDQVLPLPITEEDLKDRVLRLKVRHFVEYADATGEARIFLSRFVWLGLGPITEEVIQ